MLDDDFALMVVVAECCRRTSLLLLEDTIEVADVVEAAAVANLSNAGMRIDEQASGIAQADVDDVVADGLACPGAEETRESSWSHSGDVSKGLQTYLLLEVLVDMFLDGTNATTLRLVLHVGKRLAGQEMIVVLQREFIEDFEQGEHAIETGLSRCDARYLAVQLHDCRQFEGDASLCILEESTQAGELILLEELLAKQVGRELNGNLVDGMALAVVLVPHVFQAASDQHQVILTQHFDAVANNATSAITMLHKVQLHLLVLVQRISERVFVTIDHQEAVFFAKRGDLSKYFVCHKF